MIIIIISYHWSKRKSRRRTFGLHAGVMVELDRVAESSQVLRFPNKDVLVAILVDVVAHEILGVVGGGVVGVDDSHHCEQRVHSRYFRFIVFDLVEI
jgi:hypothetical protein